MAPPSTLTTMVPEKLPMLMVAVPKGTAAVVPEPTTLPVSAS